MFSFIFLIINLLNSLDQALASFAHSTISSSVSPGKTTDYSFVFSGSLIHCSSLESTFFDPSYTKTMASLILRVASPGSSVFLARIAITKGGTPYFNSKKSSSHQKGHCFDRKCDMAPGRSCGSFEVDDPSLCLYYAAYFNNSTSRGIGSSMSESGMTTPLLPNDHGSYCLILTGINVDGSDLDFPSGIFEKAIDEDVNAMGFLIDSGRFVNVFQFHQQRNFEVRYGLEKNLPSLAYPRACPDEAVAFFIMLSFVLLFINTFYFVDQVSASPSPQKSTDNVIFSAPLIHRSSAESPFFDPNYTRDAHIEDGVNTSLARAHYFSQMKASSKDYVSAPISGWSLLMKFFIGTPPVVGYGVFDTGSTFTWIQCRPCIECIKQDYPLFDSRHSSSFQKLICSDNRCQMGPATSCGSSLAVEPNLCLYYITYWDTSTSRGIVSTETMTLSAENTSRTEKSVVFGCGNDNESEGYPGVVGLGKGGSSLLNQFSVSHFSYHVFANGDYIHGVVHFGPGASLSHLGMTTPILSNDQAIYFLNLTGISVDGSDLKFPKGVFEMGTDEDGNSLGFVIDSGSTYTMLPSEVYDVFKAPSWRQCMSVPQKAPQVLSYVIGMLVELLRLCFSSVGWITFCVMQIYG
ncbi:hypothetical protein Cgig2_031443 [Carnegiea gigantea]|uniref:Peptidase A1 domain-containing protein n=1 Tax=Carnegiea gigantea TaxID=171969 RepID=A0A9Q1K7U7_9CARY|nr:hypothetical protein Cgig2_031443 [Carnegiea gigantea]